MALQVAGEKKGGLTFAPEAGSQRMRDVINKGVTEEDFLERDACRLRGRVAPLQTLFHVRPAGGARRGHRRHRRARRPCARYRPRGRSQGQRGGVSVSISVSVFIPKASTPFQWCAQTPDDEVKRRQQLLLKSVKNRAVRVHYHDAETSLLEAALSRGGRDLAPVIVEAWRRGARFDAWTEQFRFPAGRRRPSPAASTSEW